MKVSTVVLPVVFALSGAAYAQPTPAPSAPPTPAVSTMGGFMQNCGADLQKFCPTAQTRKDQRQCVHQNRASVSLTCSNFLAAKQAARQQRMQGQTSSPSAPPSSLPDGSGH